MATALTKRVARKTVGAGPNRRPFVVTLEAGDTIGFRDARTRKTYWISLRACYELAIKATVAFERKQRAAAKRGKR